MNLLFQETEKYESNAKQQGLPRELVTTLKVPLRRGLWGLEKLCVTQIYRGDMVAKPLPKMEKMGFTVSLYWLCVHRQAIQRLRVQDLRGNRYLLFLFAFYGYDKHMAKSNPGRKGLFSPYRLSSIIKGSQCGNLEAGTEAEAMEECCFLACLSWLVKSTF